jgi:hypothetical protein
MVLGEECQLRFALETKVSGEDTFMDKLLDNELKIDWSLLTDKQKGSFFKLLIRGTGAKNSQYTGFNVSTKSRDFEEDVARVETMKNHALLELHTFTSTRKFTDWIICYLEDMRSKIAQASV